MSKKVAVLFDLETAGFHGGICQIGSIDLNSDLNVLGDREHITDPEREMGIDAIAVHGITEEMVKGQPTIDKVVDEHLPTEGYLLAYNISFDSKMLRISNIEIPEGVKLFCVYELVQKLYPKHTLKHSQKNAAMFYGLGAYRDFEYEGALHTSLHDCRVTLATLKVILKENNLTLDEAYELLYGKGAGFVAPEEIPVGDREVHLRKYKGTGTTFKQLCEADKPYVNWMLDKYDFKGDTELEKFLKENV
ncbi:RNase T exonuclease/DNA polymerase III [Vibrio phage 1.170.O._10N.261.52.C3]|nr:RNase T exonuclease/DNA polymerase III [Vibrio phage 1.170.O._10N.261.52.C3]